MSAGTLTPEGARLLRQARDQILAHPEQFFMGVWVCGSMACIAGHIAINMGLLEFGKVKQKWCSTQPISKALGFEDDNVDVTNPLYDLFYNINLLTPDDARDAINAFLWRFGYPHDEVAEPAATAERIIVEQEA